MTSTLQQQLQQLAQAAGIATGPRPRGKPSLLWSYQDAADRGIEEIFTVALQGFDQLCRVDPRFQAYRKTLFSPSTQTLDRDAQTAEVNTKLDASIAGFTALLSSYFLLPAATKALEYLVRRFRAHELNVPDLMRAALPYHSTPEFVRVVQIARLDGTIFAFLEPMKASGAVLPRALLVQRCLTDRGLLRFVCEAAQDLGGPRVAARAVMPFFAALLCELVAEAPAVDESLLSMFLPYLLRGLGGDVAPDYRAAIYMVLVQLATRAAFSGDLCNAVTLELCKSATPAGLPQALLVLCHLAVTQRALAENGLPDNAFKHLAKLPGLAAELRTLAAKAPPRAQRLVAALTLAAARHLRSHENYARLMDELLSTVPLGAAAGALAQALLDLAAEDVTAAANAPVIAALRTLDQRYPAISEKAVNDALQKRGDSGPERERLAAALRDAFAGSLRAPMPEAGTTLALAVDAASAGIRRLALERLDELAGGDTVDEEAEEVLRGALLRRLADEHAAVVQTALGLRALLRLPPAAVLESLSACLAAALASATAKNAKKSDRADARGIARKIIKILTGSFAETHPEDLDRVAELVLTAVLAAPHTRSVAEAAVRRGGHVAGAPLLAALADADLTAAQPKKEKTPPATASKGKRGAKTPKKGAKQAAAAVEDPAGQGARGYDDVAHNRAVVEALARAVAADADAQAALGRLLGSAEPRARGLALAVANAALRLPGGAPLAAQVLHRFTGEGSGPAEGAPAFDSVTGVLEGSAMVALASGGITPVRLEPAVVLTSLRLLPTAALKDMGKEGLERLFTRLCALPGDVWRPHLDVLVARAAEVADPSELLGAMWGAPGGGAAVQATALRLWTQNVLSAPPTSPTKRGKGASAAADAAAGPAAAVAALPRLLAVLGHADRILRAAAVQACTALAENAESWWPEGAALPRAAGAALLTALAAQGAAIKADSEAAEALLRGAVEGDDTGLVSPQKKAARGKKKGDGTAAAGHLSLESSTAAALQAFLLGELPRLQGPAGLAAAPFIVRVIHDAAKPEALLSAGRRLLSTFALANADGSSPSLRPLRSSLERTVAAELAALFNDAALVSAVRGGGDEASAAVGALLAMLAVPGPEGSADVRRAAVAALTPVSFAALPLEAQRASFVALTVAAAQDVEKSGRDAALAALAALPLTADILLPLLTVSDPEEEPASAAKRKRRPAVSSAPSAGLGPGFSTYVATLEVLQWKEDVEDEVALVPQLQTSLDAVLSASQAAAAAAAAAEQGEDAEAADDEDGSGAQAARAYSMQLALALLLALARRHLHAAGDADEPPAPTTASKAAKKGTAAKKKGDQPFDVAVAVRCAQAAPDGAVRAAALELVGALAAAMPQAALDHVLTVVSVVGDASAELVDAHSSAVAAATLGAVATAWVRSGGDAQELVEAVVGAAVAAPAPRRLPLLRALTAALPLLEGTTVVVLALLRRQLAGAGGDEDEGQWGVALAQGVLQQASAVVQAQAMAALLEAAMTGANDNPAAPEVLLATAFATSRLAATPTRGTAPAAPDAELQVAYEALMRRALAQLQRAGELAAPAPPPASAVKKTPRKAPKAAETAPVASPELLKTATNAAYALTEALRHVMSPAAYVAGLVGLAAAAGAHDKVRRRALQLLSAAVLAEKEDRRGREADPALATAALAAVEPIAALLSGDGGEGTSELTRQVALGTLGALAQAFGARHPQRFLAAMPAVTALTTSTAPQPVRSSALTCVAAMAAALGRQLVPVLPPTVNAVMAAAQAAAAAAAAGSAAAAVPAAADSDDDEEGGAAGATVSEAAALELAAALTALVSLVNALGAFMSPHLPQLLSVVLNPAVLSCQASQCAEIAAAIRGALARDIPARLLLTPLADALDATAAGGPAPTCALLDMLRGAVEAMDAEAVAGYHEAVFTTLLRAMDLRRRGAAASPASPAAGEVEAAAVAVLVELTMKLSETRFKPLFFRLVEWATAPPPGGDSPLPRAVALLAAANALSQRLRSVFTPYFQAMMDPIVSALDRDGAAAAGATAPAKKKRKKAATVELGDVPAELAPLEPLLRLLAVRALHRCFLHDTSGFLDEARFDRLLGPLVAQLGVENAEEAAPLLLPDPVLEAALAPEAAAALDVPARAAVACLAQMALASGGGDARWRPLNHAVLMATRAAEPRARLAALEAAAGLAAALQEEYLALLPEALPFLAELLEDAEQEVEARAAATLRALEEMSGEDLKEYLK